MAAARIDQITAELQTENGSAALPPAVERLKTGFLTFKTTKYKYVSYKIFTFYYSR